ncbi:MAG TPA: YdcF family protein [Beijerinckiaceae bacterium]|jgi:uncharacterized SAM-binding protein YcdF (DUF218 family)
MRSVLAAVFLAAGVLCAAAFIEVAIYSRHGDDAPADAAIVLGAAVYDDRPSPVFRERIRHAVMLHRAGRVRVLLMTGGRAAGDHLSEGEAAAEWARQQGVPPTALLVEARSRTTRENIANSVPLLKAHQLDRVLIVSDPLHMRRAVAIARALGLNARPSPTPTTRYTGWGSWTGFLLSEAYHLNRCRLLGAC